jgi:hypothetical protein
MRNVILCLLVVSLFPILSFIHQTHAADDVPPYDWKQLDPIFGTKGELKDGVYSFTLPRNDLNVAVDGMEIPTAAGIASQFFFFRCSCGKMRVVGQFCCCDYETNDVIDAIRPGALLEVSNIGPMFNSDKPRLSIVRFQGEGDATAMAKLLKNGLTWMGDARTTTQPAR